MKVAYKGFDKTGQPVTATIEARDIADAGDQLRRQGVYVTEAAEASDAPSGKVEAGSSFGHGKRLKLVSMFLRQTYVLMATGTPLAEALSSLERQATDKAFKAVVGSLVRRVEQGSALSLAMRDHPRYFNAVCRGLVAAGESGGQLDSMLDRLSILARKEVTVRASIIGAMIYPALLTTVAIAVLCTLLVFVLPRFAGLFATLDSPLPPTTKFLMMCSDLLRGYWWALPFIIGGTGMGVWSFLKTPLGRRKFDLLCVRVPVFGPIVRSFETAKLTRLLGILVVGKVPLLEAIDLTRAATNNSCYVGVLNKAEAAVTNGDPLAGAFSDASLVAPNVAEAVRSGEKSGQLGSLMSTLADFLDEENEITLRSLTSIIEPIILIVLGVLVGFIAISMFMPLFDLTAATGAH